MFACEMIELLLSFSFWTFNVLYNVDLWSALVGQTFEPKIDSWQDFNWFDSQFVSANAEVIPQLDATPSLLHSYLIGMESYFSYSKITKTNVEKIHLPHYIGVGLNLVHIR